MRLLRLPITKHIPKPLYWLCQKLLPIVTVDIVVVHGKKVLLLKRAIWPLRGDWVLPGGRIFRNEALIDAARRKLKQETNLVPTLLTQCGAHEYFHGKRHCISITFLGFVNNDKVILDFQHSDYIWMLPNQIPQDISPVVKKQVHDALKVKERQ